MAICINCGKELRGHLYPRDEELSELECAMAELYEEERAERNALYALAGESSEENE